MVLPLIGAGLMAGGAVAGAAGTYQRDQAQRGVFSEYLRALNAYTGREQAAAREEQGAFTGLQNEGIAGTQSYIDAVGQRPSDDGFMQRVGQLQQGAATAAPTGGSWAMQGAPAAQTSAFQGAKTAQDNGRMAASILADHEQRQIQNKTKAAGFQKSFADLLRQSKSSNMSNRFQLATALRQLDWQKQQAALQQHLDNAGREGQWLSMLSGPAMQTGSMLMTAGLAGGGAEAGAAGGEPVPWAGADQPGSTDPNGWMLS